MKVTQTTTRTDDVLYHASAVVKDSAGRSVRQYAIHSGYDKREAAKAITTWLTANPTHTVALGIDQSTTIEYTLETQA